MVRPFSLSTTPKPRIIEFQIYKNDEFSKFSTVNCATNLVAITIASLYINKLNHITFSFGKITL